MNPTWDGGKTLKKRENSAKRGKVGMSGKLLCSITATQSYLGTEIQLELQLGTEYD